MRALRVGFAGLFAFALVAVVSMSVAAQDDSDGVVARGGGVVAQAPTVAAPTATRAPAATARPAVVAPAATARPAVVAPAATARPAAVMPAAMPRTGGGGTASSFVNEGVGTNWMLLGGSALVAGVIGAGVLRTRRAA